MGHRNRLTAVISSLPGADALVEAESMDDRARAALGLVLDARVAEWATVPSNPLECPNCGRLESSTRSPYCGEGCREMAAFVRQTRAAIADGSAELPDKQLALGQTAWRLLGGGRPYRQYLILEKPLRKVIEKANGLCVCGAPAVTADHIGTG